MGDDGLRFFFVNLSLIHGFHSFELALIIAGHVFFFVQHLKIIWGIFHIDADGCLHRRR